MNIFLRIMINYTWKMLYVLSAIPSAMRTCTVASSAISISILVVSRCHLLLITMTMCIFSLLLVVRKKKNQEHTTVIFVKKEEMHTMEFIRAKNQDAHSFLILNVLSLRYVCTMILIFLSIYSASNIFLSLSISLSSVYSILWEIPYLTSLFKSSL